MHIIRVTISIVFIQDTNMVGNIDTNITENMDTSITGNMDIIKENIMENMCINIEEITKISRFTDIPSYILLLWNR